jgi:hypothetical protein
MVTAYYEEAAAADDADARSAVAAVIDTIEQRASFTQRSSGF